MKSQALLALLLVMSAVSCTTAPQTAQAWPPPLKAEQVTGMWLQENGDGNRYLMIWLREGGKFATGIVVDRGGEDLSVEHVQHGKGWRVRQPSLNPKHLLDGHTVNFGNRTMMVSYVSRDVLVRTPITTTRGFIHNNQYQRADARLHRLISGAIGAAGVEPTRASNASD